MSFPFLLTALAALFSLIAYIGHQNREYLRPYNTQEFTRIIHANQGNHCIIQAINSEHLNSNRPIRPIDFDRIQASCQKNNTLQAQKSIVQQIQDQAATSPRSK